MDKFYAIYLTLRVRLDAYRPRSSHSEKQRDERHMIHLGRHTKSVRAMSCLLASRHHRDHEKRDMKQDLIRRRLWNQCVVHDWKIMMLGDTAGWADVIDCLAACCTIDSSVRYKSSPFDPDRVLSSIFMQRKMMRMAWSTACPYFGHWQQCLWPLRTLLGIGGDSVES